MDRKLSPEQLEIYNRLDEILWEDWDPIGVHGMDGARDEYHSYLPVVFQMVLGCAPASEIARYLDYVATQQIGISCYPDHLAYVAEKIHSLEKKP